MFKVVLHCKQRNEHGSDDPSHTTKCFYITFEMQYHCRQLQDGGTVVHRTCSSDLDFMMLSKQDMGCTAREVMQANCQILF